MLDIIVPRIFWFPLQPWSPWPRCSLSRLWVDMRCPPPLLCPWCHHFLSPLRDTRHVTHSSRVTRGLSVVWAGRVTWHCEPGEACDNCDNRDMMTGYEYSSNGKSGDLFYWRRGASIFVKQDIIYGCSMDSQESLNDLSFQMMISYFLPRKEFDLPLSLILQKI